jgi:hypothetical protein
MPDFVIDPLPPAIGSETASLFLWRGAGIVLLGGREGERWILARAWLEGDRLAHVRRWSFAQPIPFSGQVRRLIMDATADAELAQAQGIFALTWAEAAA